MATRIVPRYFKDPSKLWSIVFLAMFVVFSYRNILQQTEVAIKLPKVNLVHILNNHKVFTKDPTPEKIDLYLSLGKIFETFKDDYMKHYNEYALMLYTYITLEESEIAFKFYAQKQFFEKAYMRKDYFSLGTAITEFVKNFYTRDFRSKANIFEHKHYQMLQFNNNKSKCEEFFNAYVYPLYLAQDKRQEIDIASSLNTVFTLWTTLKMLQLIILVCSLVFFILVVVVFSLQKADPLRFFKNQFTVGTLLFVALTSLIASFVCSFTSMCISLSMYDKAINYKGGYNALFNVVQLLYILLIVYFSINWIKDLRVELTMEEEKKTLPADTLYLLKPLGGHTIKRHFKSLLKNEDKDKNNNDMSSIIAEFGTAVTNNAHSRHRKNSNTKGTVISAEQNDIETDGNQQMALTAVALETAVTQTNAPPTSITGAIIEENSGSGTISMETAQLLETVPFAGQPLNIISKTSLDQPTAQLFNIAETGSVLNGSSQIPTDESSSGISKDYLTYTNVPLSGVLTTSRLKSSSSKKPTLTQIQENSADPISGVTTPFVTGTAAVTTTGTKCTGTTVLTATDTCSSNLQSNPNESSYYGTSKYSSSGFYSSEFTRTATSKSSSNVGLAAMGIPTSKSPGKSACSRDNTLD